MGGGFIDAKNFRRDIPIPALSNKQSLVKIVVSKIENIKGCGMYSRNLTKIVALVFVSMISMSSVFGQTIGNSTEDQKAFFAVKNGDVDQIKIHTSLGDTTIHLRNSGAEARVLVEFYEGPMFVQKAQPSFLTQNALTSRFAQFRLDLSQIGERVNKSLKKKTVPITVIHKEFKKLFCGVSLTTNETVINELRKLSYVKRIHKSVEIRAVDDVSSHIMRADSVRSKFATKGDGVVVGVIDTGIDYLHPAMGGGFGPSFKVIGGYDIYNQDNDPMDDHYHGTHIAGIIAGNDVVIQGVAPHAKLMAFKVLGADGSATTEQIIEGIERAADPNDDGNFDDKVDIINMSLGGDGDADDPISSAVDNAVRLGIVCCVSAGNNGSRYTTIASPGTSRLAITVGASDEDDNIADFSSRGPNAKIYSIKPDVVTHGVNVYSSVLNSSYSYKNGTSMAAPNVAGVCALLKAIHPDWTPGRIKSALVSTAVDIGEDVMTQGGGRVDAFNAATVGTFVEPSQLSFGLDASDQSLWAKKDTLWVYNEREVGQNYNVSYTGLEPGINIITTPSSFNIAPHDSQRIIVELFVDNTILPYSSKESATYEGSFLLDGDADDLNFPWAFAKLPIIVLNFDRPFVSLITISGGTYSVFGNTDNGKFEALLPSGDYSMSLFFSGDSIYFREDVHVDGHTVLDISGGNLKNTVQFNAVDETGLPFSSSEKYRITVFTTWLKKLGITLITQNKKLFISDFTAVAVECKQFQTDLDNQRKAYEVRSPKLNAILGDINFTNTINDYVSQKLVFKYPLGLPNGALYFNGLLKLLEPTTSQYDLTFYLTKTFKPDSGLFFGNTLDVDWPNNKGYFAPLIFASNDTMNVLDWNSLRKYKSPTGGTMTFGASLLTPISAYWNTPTNIYPEIGFWGELFEPQVGFNYTKRYSLYDANRQIIQTYNNYNDLSEANGFGVSPGVYEVEVVDTSHFIDDVKRRVILTGRLDTRLEDSAPPEIRAIRLVDDQNIQRDGKTKGDNSFLYFAAADYAGGSNWKNREYRPLANETHCYFRLYGDEVWQELTAEYMGEDSIEGKKYRVNLSALPELDSVGIDVRIHVEDSSGNTTEWVMEPGFAIGKVRKVDHIPPQLYLGVLGTPAIDRIRFVIGADEPLSQVELRVNQKNITIEQLPQQNLFAGEYDLEGEQHLTVLAIAKDVFLNADTTIKDYTILQLKKASQYKQYKFSASHGVILVTPYHDSNVPDGYIPIDEPIEIIGTVNTFQITAALDDKKTYEAFKIGLHELTENGWKLIDKQKLSSESGRKVVGLFYKTSTLPTRWALYPNFPNPFNPTTTIRYDVPIQSKTVLKIYNMLGQEVRTLVNSVHVPGIYRVEWDGRNNTGQYVSTGMYLYRMHAGAFVQTRKLLLLK